MAEAGRDLWWSSGPTPLLKQDHLEPSVQGPRPDIFWISPSMEIPQPPLATCGSSWSPSQWQSVSWCSDGTSCASFQSVPIVSGPVPGHLWAEPGSVLLTTFLQVFIYIDEIPPKPSLLQDEQSKLSQPLLIGEMLQSPSHLRGTLLKSLQYVHVS